MSWIWEGGSLCEELEEGHMMGVRGWTFKREITQLYFN